ncbi:RNA polymerase sigma factor SigJ [Paenibacillus sp. J31TS4]|uniref:sigma-70 family RNA polymerase sigma factor n=1 Tax=Paenibacillus sp. J31TS4 TaxID=2807195 RepID=UPI001B12AA1A|nr:sigma-70 family RNA polymerase sigma factor [Paenibacillus sp. J31TS4]GIP37191.1 RNA polymerase sigma factor SigJ [Paenibacillus sp. J31TS4]
MELDSLYRTYRPLLSSVAYRMLGSIAEAEDAVQDVFAALSREKPPEVHHPKAYLVKLVTNRSLNLLRSARRRRERYTGPWLPEPELAFSPGDLSEEFALRESFGYALLVLLETLSPAERAVYVLRESLDYEYGEIAGMLGKNEAACRKLLSRARAKLGKRDAESDSVPSGDAEPYVRAFADALRTGEFEPFLGLLADDAVLISDGGGKVRSALFPILGKARIHAFFAGLRAKGSLQGELRAVWLSGQRGWLLVRPPLHPIAICFGPGAGDRADRVYLVTNPDKLTRMSADRSQIRPLPCLR